MQSNMINNVILAADYSHALHRATYPGQIEGDPIAMVNNPYFFLRKELAITHDTWAAAKQRGDIRHCKVYNGKFLDYVVNKQFDTFNDWLVDAGGKLDEVLYGVNRVHKFVWVRDEHNRVTRVSQTPKYVELSVLLRYLGYNEPPAVNPVDDDIEEITAGMERLMNRYGMTVDNVWVIQHGTPIQWNEFMA